MQQQPKKKLLATSTILKGKISLEGSKSISNRLLIIHALSQQKPTITNLSPSDDTSLLQKALSSNHEHINIEAAGTAMRFLTAYFAAQKGQNRLLTGSKRMLQRPIHQLVTALRQLGADIQYLGQEGFPPLYIKGKKLEGGHLFIEANVSSQFISALLLIAPTLKQGLRLTLEGKPVSESYLKMTLYYLQKYGIVYSQISPNEIHILPSQNYLFSPEMPCYVEADWSAASYYYALAALSHEADITLQGLSYPSIQGDSVIVKLMAHFGITTYFLDNAIQLVKLPTTDNKSIANTPTIFDFIECPDIAQTIAVIMAGLRQRFVFEGLQTLHIKETDRCLALATELKKFNVSFIPINAQQWLLDAQNANFSPTPPPTIQTYHDHRMALSFAALTLCNIKEGLNIENPEVVSKSYPNFWRDIEQLGFIRTT